MGHSIRIFGRVTLIFRDHVRGRSLRFILRLFELVRSLSREVER